MQLMSRAKNLCQRLHIIKSVHEMRWHIRQVQMFSPLRDICSFAKDITPCTIESSETPVNQSVARETGYSVWPDKFELTKYNFHSFVKMTTS